MSRWLYTIDISESVTKAENGEGRVADVVTEITSKMIDLPVEIGEAFSSHIIELNELVKASEPEDIDADEYDEIMDQMYDVADSLRVWIKTIR